MSKWLLVIPLVFAVIIGGYVGGANETDAMQYQIMKQELIEDNLRLADEIRAEIKKQNEILSKINELMEDELGFLNQLRLILIYQVLHELKGQYHYNLILLF